MSAPPGKLTQEDSSQEEEFSDNCQNDEREDESIECGVSDEESPQDYRPGGYHPVSIGEKFLNRYVVLQKLGWGHFSTVWLCKDLKTNGYVALKIQKSAQHYLEAAYDEIDLLLKVSRNANNPIWIESCQKYHENEPTFKKEQGVQRQHCYVVQLLNSFLHWGPHGKHAVMVFEVLGVNLLEIIKRYDYKGVPLPICRKIAKQVLIGLDYLHRICGIINTDLKPENVLVQLTQPEIKEILNDGKLTFNPKKPLKTKDQPFTPLVNNFDLNNLTTEQRKKIKKAEKRKKARQKKRVNAQQQTQQQNEDKQKQETQKQNSEQKKTENKSNIENTQTQTKNSNPSNMVTQNANESQEANENTNSKKSKKSMKRKKKRQQMQSMADLENKQTQKTGETEQKQEKENDSESEIYLEEK